MASADFCLFLFVIAFILLLKFTSLAFAHTADSLNIQTSQGKFFLFLFMQPLYLRSYNLYSIGLLFLMQHHPHNHASYKVSVRRLEYLPTASFRFYLTVNTLALG
jgi:hypothetical protein